MRQRAVTARRIEAIARQGLPQLAVLAGDSPGEEVFGAFEGALDGLGRPPAEGGEGAAPGGSSA